MSYLIDRDEVKRELNAQYAVAKNTANPDAVEQILREVSKFFDSFPAVNRWIPVEDALPDALQNVLVCTDINTVTIAWINGDGWTFADTGGGHTENWSFADVKFWMNLPEPPKGEQK